ETVDPSSTSTAGGPSLHSGCAHCQQSAWSICYIEVHALEGISGNLRPDAVLLHRNLVHLDIVDFELAGLLIHPEINVVIFVCASRFAKVGACEIFAFLLEMTYRLVNLHEL